jgi:hypothetical protein
VLRPLLALAVTSCSSSGDDVVGPFTGTVHRYAVAAITLPVTSDQAQQLGDDLLGDGTIHNQLGTVFSALTSTGDATTHAADMIASGALASFVEIQADDLDHDGSVGVRYFGLEGADATAFGGALADGAFASNRTAKTHHPGAATIALPIFDAANPLLLELELGELDFTPGAQGELDAVVRGGIPIDDARMAATTGIAQMIAADPVRHLVFSRTFDADRDGTVTSAEIADSSVVGAFLVADLHAAGMMSVGFGVHLVPCDSGDCALSTPADTCHDRIVDGDESDVDCGGSCAKCPADENCRSVADCQTAGCDNGLCRAPSCSDGVRDGIESDVDCGDLAGCAKCQVGQVCATATDCASGHCDASAGAAGACMP